MRICMVSYDMQEFGGLEEYAVNLAIGLRQQGHNVSYLSAAWISPDNQYLRRLAADSIPVMQPAEWISKPVSDWQTKENILRTVMWFLAPLTLSLGIGVSILKKRSFRESRKSSYNWLKGQLMEHIIGPDRRKRLGHILLNWWMYRWHPDVLHVHGFSTSLMFVIEWAHNRKIPVIYEEHSTPDYQYDLWKGFDKSINKATKVIAVSEKSADALHTIYGVPHPVVVKGPLLPDPFEYGWQSNKNNYKDGHPLTITTIARLFPMKGLNYLLESAAYVKAIHPDVQFRVFGEGELRDELMAKAKELGLDGEKIFAGKFTNREELTDIMAGTDIFLLSSVLEGQPLAILEAMAYGCPVIATAVGGIPELIQDGVNGLLCKPADPQCLAQKILMLIENSALRSSLGSAARASYEQGPFQIKTVSTRFVSIYEDVLREQG